MRILVVSCYELGRQPLDAATAAGALREVGHEVQLVDLALEDWPAHAAAWADGVALAVPMHTARRLAASATARLRAQRPDLPVCWFGLYARAGIDEPMPDVHLAAGEFEPSLRRWADTFDPGVEVDLGRRPLPRPDRDGLPALDRYAHLVHGERDAVAAAVQATRGCNHRCRHCPVPVVYDGRTRVATVDDVLADVAAAVEAGAEHLTFADPDFLNRPAHALTVAEAVHEAFPQLTFDCTVKVEHVLRHASSWPRLRAAGCLFVVSAFESVDDRTLELLDKGHTASEETAAVALLREHGIEVRPSWLPFLPWARPGHVADIFDFVESNDLVRNVDPVQYSIRLLLPPGSLLLEVAEVRERVGTFDADAHTWSWTATDPAVDVLQRELASLVEDAGDDADPGYLFTELRARVHAAADRPDPGPIRGSARDVPRLTEAWYCCAEPTTAQLGALRA